MKYNGLKLERVNLLAAVMANVKNAYTVMKGCLMDVKSSANAFILRYLKSSLASIGMKPTSPNPRNCGVLFTGDEKAARGSYFVWTDGAGVVIYVADFQILEDRHFSMKFPPFVSVRKNTDAHPDRKKIVAFAGTAEQTAKTPLRRGIECKYIEVQYLTPYFKTSRAHENKITIELLAAYLQNHNQEISWSPEIDRPFNIIENSRAQGVAAEFIFSGVASLLMGTLLEMNETDVLNQDDKQAIAKVVQYINQNLDKPLRQEEMLFLAGMSATKFKRIFKQFTKMSMSDYLSQCRIELSKKLLLQGLPMQSIAENAGFYSSSYFATSFKKATGQSPSQWRKSFQMNALPPTEGTVHLIYPAS